MQGGIGDQLVAASKKIDPSKFKLYNKVSQFLHSEVSDPDLAAYKIKLIALRDEYATVINKGGVPTDASRAQANEVMDQYAPNAAASIVKAIKDVVASNKKALDTNIERANHGGQSTTTTTKHSELPDATKYDGKIATDDATGDRYKSISGKWVKQ